ncbi:hypothetical protein EYF80_062932 [Liparis tanakae]|uniref:Uncharacterized protein n=1 Tax=Liparis tanakae TaxID=230148 RepID=A0A4Z2EDH2_9TELE|nr:hypothetical protein EYF80_062932 [Liparis tanakae]
MAVQLEAVDGVMCDAPVGVQRRDPAHQDGAISVAGPSPIVVEAATLNVYSVKGVRSDTRVKAEEPKVTSPVCDSLVSQGGGVAAGTEVRGNVEVPGTAESVD